MPDTHRRALFHKGVKTLDQDPIPHLLGLLHLHPTANEGGDSLSERISHNRLENCTVRVGRRQPIFECAANHGFGSEGGNSEPEEHTAAGAIWRDATMPP